MFNKKFNWVFFLIFSLVAIPTLSQSDEQIFENFIKKNKETWDKSQVGTLYQEMVLKTMGIEIPIKFWKKNDNLRFETSFMNQKQIFVVTPNAGWQVQEERTVDIPDDELEGIRAQIINQSFISPLNIDFETEKNTNNFSIEGIEKVGDAKCYKMQMIPKEETNNNSVGTFWFDTNTYLLRKVVFSEPGNQEQNFIMEVKGYQNVGGFTFPKILEITIGQDQNVNVEFKNIKVNEPIDDSLFKK